MSRPAKLPNGLKSLLAACSFGALALTGAVVSANTDRSIESGLTTALQAAPTSRDTLVAGSEDYWLRQPDTASGVERVEWIGPVAAGGTLLIGDGTSRKELEVLSVEPQPASKSTDGVTRIDMGKTEKPALRVKAREGHHDQMAPYLWLDIFSQAHGMTSPVGL